MDLFGIYSKDIWAPFTFAIRLAVGFIIGLFTEKLQCQSVEWTVVGVLTGSVILVAGYYAAEWLIYYRLQRYLWKDTYH